MAFEERTSAAPPSFTRKLAVNTTAPPGCIAFCRMHHPGWLISQHPASRCSSACLSQQHCRILRDATSKPMGDQQGHPLFRFPVSGREGGALASRFVQCQEALPLGECWTGRISLCFPHIGANEGVPVDFIYHELKTFALAFAPLEKLTMESPVSPVVTGRAIRRLALISWRGVAFKTWRHLSFISGARYSIAQ